MAMAGMANSGEQKAIGLGIADLAEWAYADQLAGICDAGRDDLALLGYRSGAASFSAMAELGVRVDGGGCKLAGALHRDAQALVDEVAALAACGPEGLDAAALIVHYARSRTRPAKPSGADQALIAKRGGNGRALMSYASEYGRVSVKSGAMLRGVDGGTCRVGQACELVIYQLPQELVELERETYALWAAGLKQVENNLPPLTAHKLLPWREEPAQLHGLLRARMAAA